MSSLSIALASASATVLAVVLALSAWTFLKVRRVDQKVWRMADELPAQIRQLYRQLEALDAVHRELGLSRALPATREWAVSPDALVVLVKHALSARPSIVVECGSGVSTVALARCMQLNGSGHVYSLDHEQEYAEKTQQELARHGLQDWATVLHAPLEAHLLRGETWPWYRTDDLRVASIDMLFVDGPPAATRDVARYSAGPKLLPLLSADGVAFLDDAGRREEQQAIRMWKEDFPHLRVTTLDCEKGLARLTLY